MGNGGSSIEFPVGDGPVVDAPVVDTPVIDAPPTDPIEAELMRVRAENKHLLERLANLERSHAAEIAELTNSLASASETAMASVTEQTQDEVRRQLEQQERERQDAFIQRHLNSVRVYDDADFVGLGGKDEIKMQAFPFATLQIGHLTTRQSVLRIQLNDDARQLAGSVERFRKSVAVMKAYVSRLVFVDKALMLLHA